MPILTTGDNTAVKRQIESASNEEKTSVLRLLLNELNGYYLICVQKYTNDPNDKSTYEKAYIAAVVYLRFIEALGNTHFEETGLEETHQNYLFYAHQCLFQTHLPPHPSVNTFTPIESTLL